MSILVNAVRDRIESPEHRKFIKYTLASVISVIVTEVLLFALLFKLTGGWASVVASSIAAIPSFYLNRNWVWRKSGKSHMRREVIPFWIMVFIGLAASGIIGYFADAASVDFTTNHFVRKAIIVVSNVGGFAILWVVKFIIFNKILLCTTLKTSTRYSTVAPAFLPKGWIPGTSPRMTL